MKKTKMSFEILHFSASLLDIEFTFFKVVDIFNMFKELCIHGCYKRKEEVWQLFSLIGTVSIQSMIYVVKA